MIVLFYAIVVFLMLFGFVIIFGAPYVPTLNSEVEKALDLIDLKSGETLIELGSGDGVVMVAAARRNLHVIGYELNPLLVLISKWRLRKYQNATVHWANFWRAKLPKTDGVFVFLLDKYMKKLDKKIIQRYNGEGVKLVSFAFKIPGKKVSNAKDAIFMYEY